MDKEIEIDDFFCELLFLFRIFFLIVLSRFLTLIVELTFIFMTCTFDDAYSHLNLWKAVSTSANVTYDANLVSVV